MHILVTGGAGFLGSHLCERLLDQGHEVTCLDNYYTGSQKNIEHLSGNAKFNVLNHDVTIPFDIKVDGIFNLACPASPVHYQKDPVRTMQTNVSGAMNVLSLAKNLGVRVFQASTSEIYGDPQVSPQPETYWGNVNSIGIRACYDEGKRAAETLFFDYHRQYGIDIRVARIFNTYGPKMAENDGRVVSNFILQALRNEEITIYGDGTQTRSFCFVEDLIEGFIRLFFSEGIHVPVNLGNPQPITMNQLATEIISAVGSDSRISYKPLPGDDPKDREPDISRARALLGWEPEVERRHGIMKTIEYFREIS